MTTAVRVGVIGTGFGARVVAPVFEATQGCEVVDVVSARDSAGVAELFLDNLLRHGTTTAAVYPTVHAQSVDAFFAAAEARNLRMICGKILMDRNSPDYLRDDVACAEMDCRDLIQRWHGKARLGYALTPRFAPMLSLAPDGMVSMCTTNGSGLSVKRTGL